MKCGRDVDISIPWHDIKRRASGHAYVRFPSALTGRTGFSATIRRLAWKTLQDPFSILGTQIHKLLKFKKTEPHFGGVNIAI